LSINQPLPPANGNASIQAANAAAKSYPDAVQKAPQAMAGAIASGDPTAPGVVASTVHMASNATAVDNHKDMYNSHSWWQSALGDVGKVINAVPGLGTLARWAAKPLQEVQSDYKFLHSVYTDHGFGQGLVATLGVLGGGALGTLFGPEGSLIGAEIGATLVGSLERNIGGQLIPDYKNSYKKSIDPNYEVSIGRDLANGLSNIPGLRTLKDTNHGIGQFISGTADATFDFAADPLNNAGKIAQSLKSGKYLDYAKVVDKDGNAILKDGKPQILLGNDNKPIVIPTIPLAKNSPAVSKFLMSVSGTALSSDMVMNAYEAGGLAGRFNAALNPVKRAMDNIAEMAKTPETFAVNVEKTYPGTQFTPELIQKLSKVESGKDVAAIFAKSLYSGETAEKATATTALSLPTRTLARSLTSKATEGILKKAGDTSISEERNLLLPKALPVLDANGEQMFKQVINKAGDIENVPVMKAQWGGLYTKGADGWNGWNALAGKIRTFTGYKSLVVNKTLLEQSGQNFKFSDHNAGTALFNMFYYAMPRDVALEKASEIMAEPNFARQQELYAQGVKEVVKAAGLADEESIVQRVMSHAQRATTGGRRNDVAYGHDALGNTLGTVEMKASNHPDTSLSTPTDPAEVALWSYQRGDNAFINFKELRKAMRQTTVHGMMYSKADDFWTYYTDKIFAPMVLFTTGFGLRVAGSEALHQVIRNGLGGYLNDKIAFNAAKYKYVNMSPEERQAYADHLAMMTTEEDHAAALKGGTVSENSVTKDIAEKEANFAALEAEAKKNGVRQNLADARANIRPIGWVSSKIAPYIAEDKMNVLTDWLIRMHGMSIPAGVASDHLAHYALNAGERASQFVEQAGHGSTGMEDIIGLTGKDKNYHAYWAQNLSKLRNEVMARDIANDYMRLSKTKEFQSLSNEEKWNQIQVLHQARIEDTTKYADLRDTMVGLRDGKTDSFSNAQVKAFAGLVQGKDGTIHDNLIEKVANGKPTFSTELKGIAPISSPAKVLGREPRNVMSEPLQRITQLGYRTFINPVMDHVSREPIFGHYLYENYRSLKPMIDMGLLSKDEALQMAGQKATINMIPLIHNPALRSQFATISRNILPFYFAQEQAIKRYARLAYQAPQAFRDFQMINHGINNPGFVHQDNAGNKYIVYPLIGEFGNAAVRGLNALGIVSTNGLPESVTGNISSLASVLPEAKMPGINPFATIPFAALGNHFPWASKITDIATGGYPASNLLTTILPNSAMRDIFNAMQMDQKESSVHNAILSATAASYYHGDLPDNYASLPAWRQQQIIDRIDANARTNLFLKGIFSFFLPMAPNVSNDYYNKNLQSLRTEFTSLMNQVNPDTNKNYTIQEATSKFLAEHGSKAVAYTAHTTQSNVSGADLPLNKETYNWLNQNGDLMRKYQYGAAYLIPQTATDAEALKVENYLVTRHFRSKLTPQEFMDSVYIAKGWSDVSPVYTAYQELMAQARQNNDRRSAMIYTTNWNNYAQSIGANNPTWYADYQNPARKNTAENVVKEFKTMDTAGKLTGPQASGIKTLLEVYDTYHQLLLSNTITVGGIPKHLPGYSMAQNGWFTFLTQMETDNPNLTNVINSVFKRAK
jgi:hypothetical protein